MRLPRKSCCAGKRPLECIHRSHPAALCRSDPKPIVLAVLDGWGRSPDRKCEDDEPKARRFAVYIDCKARQELCRFPERSDPAARPRRAIPSLETGTLTHAHTRNPFGMRTYRISCCKSRRISTYKIIGLNVLYNQQLRKTRGEGEISPAGNIPIPLCCRAIQWPIFLLPVDHCRTPALSLPDRFRVF